MYVTFSHPFLCRAERGGTKRLAFDRFTGQKNLFDRGRTLYSAHQHGGRLPPHFFARNVEGGELHMAALGAHMAAEYDRREIFGDGKAALASRRLDAHRIRQFDEEDGSRAARDDDIEGLAGRPTTSSTCKTSSAPAVVASAKPRQRSATDSADPLGPT
ncbi:hypothetical protein AJ87_38115 [Rhizobium yanglingense]|nr:hypothetical protein AJ87_38115 [Rhizobium yanglingense]